MQRKIKNKHLIYIINIYIIYISIYTHIFALYASLEINKQSNPIPRRSIHNQRAVMRTAVARAAQQDGFTTAGRTNRRSVVCICVCKTQDSGRLIKCALPGDYSTLTQ